MERNQAKLPRITPEQVLTVRYALAQHVQPWRAYSSAVLAQAATTKQESRSPIPDSINELFHDMEIGPDPAVKAEADLFTERVSKLEYEPASLGGIVWQQFKEQGFPVSFDKNQFEGARNFDENDFSVNPGESTFSVNVSKDLFLVFHKIIAEGNPNWRRNILVAVTAPQEDSLSYVNGYNRSRNDNDETAQMAIDELGLSYYEDIIGRMAVTRDLFAIAKDALYESQVPDTDKISLSELQPREPRSVYEERLYLAIFGVATTEKTWIDVAQKYKEGIRPFGPEELSGMANGLITSVLSEG